jgi:hypothetical protein
MSDWTWSYDPDELADSLPPDVRKEVERIAAELAVVSSMTYLDGSAYQGSSPGVGAEFGTTAEGRYVMLHYLTDVRGEGIIIVSVSAT